MTIEIKPDTIKYRRLSSLRSSYKEIVSAVNESKSKLEVSGIGGASLLLLGPGQMGWNDLSASFSASEITEPAGPTTFQHATANYLKGKFDLSSRLYFWDYGREKEYLSSVCRYMDSPFLRATMTQSHGLFIFDKDKILFNTDIPGTNFNPDKMESRSLDVLQDLTALFTILGREVISKYPVSSSKSFPVTQNALSRLSKLPDFKITG